MLRLFLAFFLLLVLSSEVWAQRGERGAGGGPPGQRGAGGPGGGPGAGQRGAGGPGGTGMGRPRPDQPAPQPQSAPQSQPEARLPSEPAVPPPAPSIPETPTVPEGPGTVPQLATPADQVVPLTVVDPRQSGSVAPPDVPYKVIQYASRTFQKYDLNGNGFLEREEWSKMPGAPQSIDTDGDFIITLDEMIRFLALYGIHRPNPPLIPVGSGGNPAGISPFRPLSAPLKPRKEPDETKPGETEPDPADEIDENQIVGENIAEPTEEPESENEGENKKEDDLSYEQTFANQFRPTDRMYHVPLSELRGVPNWFILRDKNGDGQLSMLEFDPTLSPRGLAEFGRLDKNGDGFLTPNEVRVEK